MITHKIDPDKTISFFNLEKKKLKFTLSDENDNFSCNISKAHMMKCKHKISYNKLFNLRNIEKCW